MKDVFPLTDGWRLGFLDGGSVPATVPGCVHTDLMNAGLLADPCLGRNDGDSAWIGRADWTYRTDLAVPATGHERTDLVFDGLDTVAEIRLDDAVVGRTRNMHRPHRFDITGLTAPAAGAVPLSVCFTSAYTEATRVRAAVGDRPSAYPEPINYLRKTACNFGWDWGPTLVTAGIWQQVRLECWSTARLARVRPLVTVEDGTGRVEVRVELERSAAGAGVPLTVTAEVAGERAETALAVGADEAVVTLRVPQPDLWWPRGHGEQPLYDSRGTRWAADGDADARTPLDTFEARIGFRTVRLDTSADADGSAFTFVVNDRPLFVRGVNWIPDDVFPTRLTPARYRARLSQAADAGVNLVRVWGGGLYEDRAFYDACDALGLLVWQDFLLACAAYPEEQPLRGEIEAEARHQVARLTPHPSLVLWNGNNENLWGFRDWGWEEELAGDSWGEGYYLGLLPRVVAETDPTRPYWPGSPWSGSWRHHPNDPAHGATHSWEVWNSADYTDYLLDVPRFVAEFGWQAPPAYATLRRALGDEELAADSPGMLHHQKAEDGNGKLARGLERHFGEPRSFDAWHYLTQVNQARAVATGVEHWRARWPTCSGTIVWQLNDTWPGTSWAAVDGDGRAKPLYHELRRLYADRLLTVQPGADGGLAVAAVNHGRNAWAGEAVLRRVNVTGRVLASHSARFDAAADTVAWVPVPAELVPGPDHRDELLVADAGALRALWFPVRDKHFRYPAPEFELSLAAGADAERAEIRITARTLVRDLLLQPDRLHPSATADHGLVTLLPGEHVTITVHGWPHPDAQAAASAVFTVADAQT
jgi:beta-mannosidase